MARQKQSGAASFSEKVFDSQFRRIAIFLVISFVGLGYILSELPSYTAPPAGKELSDRHCVTSYWKLGLILTHILNFVLIPVTMRVFYESLGALGLPSSSIFASQLGLAFIMVAVATEIGWHVTQCWYYRNDFSTLNFTFYFFKLSAFALWSDGLVKNPTYVTDLINVIFAILLFVASVLYPIGYATNNSNYKFLSTSL